MQVTPQFFVTKENGDSDIKVLAVVCLCCLFINKVNKITEYDVPLLAVS